MSSLNDTFNALLREAQFTKEMLSSGATQIRNANYASKGIYFQAFTSLSTGLERIGKLCLMLDHYIETHGNFPDCNYLKKEVGHKIALLYQRSQSAIKQRSIRLTYLQDLSDPVHQAILKVLHDFAEGDRYSNINLLVGNRPTSDPIATWFNEVDLLIYKKRVSKRKKQTITLNAAAVAALTGSHSAVLHRSETGGEITDLEEASYLTGVYEALAPYRQLYVLQIVRYWVEFLSELEHLAQGLGKGHIPFFGELFRSFFNADSYFGKRKTWEGI